MKQPLGDDFEFAFSCNAPPAWKFCAAQTDERLPRLLDCRKWKTTARPRKTLRQPETTTGPRKTRARTRKRARDHPRARPLGHRSCGGAPPCPRPTRGREGLTQKTRKCSACDICPSLGSRSKTDLETQRTEKKAFRARADSAQSARQGGTEPGTTRFKDGRATTGPPAPWRDPARPRFSRGQEGST